MAPPSLPFQTEVESLMQHLRHDIQGDKVLQLPLTIGQYKIKRLVGRGGMGDVYEVENLLLKRPEAIKFIRSKLTLNPEAIKRFKTEIESTAQLQHPNIVTVYNAGEFEQRPYMVMEFLNGQTIHQYVQDKISHNDPVTIPEAIEIIVQAARGLQYAHEKGFIHRDIKPGNLWRTPDGTIKVLDLGLVMPMTDGTSDFQMVGTPDFMAPEQAGQGLRSQGEINPGPMVPRSPSPSYSSPQSDIYSLGCTLFYILTGHVPFGGKEFSTSDKKMEAQRTRSLPPLNLYRKDLPPRIQKVLNRMTAKRPEDRYASMNEVIKTLTSKSVPKPLLLTVTGLALLGITLGGFQHSYKQSKADIQSVQNDNIVPVQDVIVPFPVGKKAGEKLVRVVDGLEYVFRWCPPGEFLMGNHGVFISKQMSIEELLELATTHQLLESNKLLEFKQAADQIAKQEISNVEPFNLKFNKKELQTKIYSQLIELSNVTGEPPQMVTFPHGFWTLDCEVTQQMWLSVMSNNSGNQDIIKFNEQDNVPVRNITWNDTQEFCHILSQRLKENVQLLTNAQWEYACKAGMEENTVQIPSQAVSILDALPGPAVVKSKQPNAWGIYDMLGNVFEWCADEEELAGLSSQVDSETQISPIARHTNSNEKNKTLRGGCYINDPNKFSFFSMKYYESANKKTMNAGFRFCVIPK